MIITSNYDELGNLLDSQCHFNAHFIQKWLKFFQFFFFNSSFTLLCSYHTTNIRENHFLRNQHRFLFIYSTPSSPPSHIIDDEITYISLGNIFPLSSSHRRIEIKRETFCETPEASDWISSLSVLYFFF